jgi:hypothetical protein
MTLIPELRADLRAAALRPDRRLAHRWTKLLRPKLFVATGGLTLAGAIVALVLVLSASTATSPAYALTRQPDGTITLTLYRLTNDIPALNARLAQMGIDETIVPVTSTCTYQFPIYPVGGPSFTITLRPHHYDLAPGYQGVLAAEALPSGKIALAQGALKPADIPPCFATVAHTHIRIIPRADQAGPRSGGSS